MEHSSEISSCARSKIRRHEPPVWEECPGIDADLPLVHKHLGGSYRCRCVLVDTGGNIVDYASTGVIGPSDPI